MRHTRTTRLEDRITWTESIGRDGHHLCEWHNGTLTIEPMLAWDWIAFHRHERLAGKLCKKLSRQFARIPVLDRYAALQECLWRCAVKWDADAGTQFSTYYYAAAPRWLMNQNRGKWAPLNAASLSRRDGGVTEIADVRESELASVHRFADLAEEAGEVLAEYTPMSQRIITNMFADEVDRKDRKAMAREFGVPAVVIYRAERSCREDLARR